MGGEGDSISISGKGVSISISGKGDSTSMGCDGWWWWVAWKVIDVKYVFGSIN